MDVEARVAAALTSGVLVEHVKGQEPVVRFDPQALERVVQAARRLPEPTWLAVRGALRDAAEERDADRMLIAYGLSIRVEALRERVYRETNDGVERLDERKVVRDPWDPYGD